MKLVKKLIAVGLLFFMIGVVIGGYILKNWDPNKNIPQVTLDRLNAEEAAWYARGILDYRILVSVEFASEQRRYEVFVRAGQFSEARSAGWDQAAQDWAAFEQAPQEEAEFFTVPGMFSLLRTDLLSEKVEREVLRSAIGPGLYPETLFLGRIIQDGFPVDGTELLIKVLEFEEISGK